MTYRKITLRIPKLKAAEPQSDPITGPDEAVAILRAYLDRTMAPCDREVFGVLYLNARGRVVGCETTAIGTMTMCLVHPREVFRGAISAAAVSIIHWHTHPSGESSPSPEDFELHERLKMAGEVIGIPVMDGLVLGRDNHTSMTIPLGVLVIPMG